MRKYALLMSIVVLLTIFAAVGVASAKLQIHYDYSVTNNYHGIDIPLNTPVVAVATTTNPDVNSVVFIWKDGTATEQWRETVALNSGQAESTGQPDSSGDWGIQALFVGSSGNTIQEVENVVEIRATSVNVVSSINRVPEVPILGTAGIVGALVIGSILQVKRKNKKI